MAARSSGRKKPNRKRAGKSSGQAPGRASRNPGRIDATAPDRVAIMDTLDHAGRPLKRRELVDALDVKGQDSLEILRRRLKAMVRDGQLIKNRADAYGLAQRMDMVRGRVTAHPDGYGFLVPDEGGDDLYLSSREMRPVLHGDRVLASVVAVALKGAGRARSRKCSSAPTRPSSDASWKKAASRWWCPMKPASARTC